MHKLFRIYFIVPDTNVSQKAAHNLMSMKIRIALL